MLFNEKKSARDQMMRVREQRDPTMHAVDGYGSFGWGTGMPSETEAGEGGVVSTPSNGVDWSSLFVAGSKLTSDVLKLITDGTKPATGSSCPAGHTFVAQAGVCMTPEAYQAWAASQKGSSMTPMLIAGGIGLVGLALILSKKGGGSLSGYSRRKRRHAWT